MTAALKARNIKGIKNTKRNLLFFGL